MISTLPKTRRRLLCCKGCPHVLQATWRADARAWGTRSPIFSGCCDLVMLIWRSGSGYGCNDGEGLGYNIFRNILPVVVGLDTRGRIQAGQRRLRIRPQTQYCWGGHHPSSRAPKGIPSHIHNAQWHSDVLDCSTIHCKPLQVAPGQKVAQLGPGNVWPCPPDTAPDAGEQRLLEHLGGDYHEPERQLTYFLAKVHLIHLHKLQEMEGRNSIA